MANRTKKVTVEEVPAKVVTPLAETAQQPVSQLTARPDFKIGRIFWGLILVVIGGLVLLNNFGLVAVDWTNVWKLWPLGVIAAGVSLLSVRHWLWRALTLLLMVASLGLVVYVAVVAPASPVVIRNSTDVVIDRQSADITRADVNLKTAASQVVVRSADQFALARSRLESSVMTQSHRSVVDGSLQRTTISTQGGGDWWIGDGLKTDWDVALTRGLPLDVSVDIGASDADIDLSQARLQSLTVTSGASNVMIKIGARENLTRLVIDSGASSVVVRVPKASGIQVKLDSGLVSKNFADLKEISQDSFESDGYAEALRQVTIVGKVGASSLTIERY